MNTKADKEKENRDDIGFLPEIVMNSMYWQESISKKGSYTTALVKKTGFDQKKYGILFKRHTNIEKSCCCEKKFMLGA